MLYVQKIAELEELNNSLSRDLELLRETEHLLLQDIREKDELTSFLTRKVKLKEIEENASKRGPGAAAKRASDAAMSVFGALWGRQESNSAVNELQHEAEEALR